MKLSELIDILKNIKKNKGDIQFTLGVYNEWGFLEREKDIKIVVIRRNDKPLCVIGHEDFY